MGYSENCSKREVYRNTCLPQETRKVSNKQPERKRTTPGSHGTTAGICQRSREVPAVLHGRNRQTEYKQQIIIIQAFRQISSHRKFAN